MSDSRPSKPFQAGDRVLIRGRPGNPWWISDETERPAILLEFNGHLDFWQVRYDDSPGVYYHVAEEHMDKLIPEIVDERCDCGLLKSEHSGIQGHGSAPECCQFTWVGFVFSDGRESIYVDPDYVAAD